MLIRQIIAIGRSTQGLAFTPEQEQIARRIHNECFDAVSGYFEKVYQIMARRYRISSEEQGQFTNFLRLALHGAFERFNPDAQNMFSTYANSTLDGAAKRYLRDTARTQNFVTRHQRELYGHVAKLEGQGKTVEGVAKELDITIEEILVVKAAYHERQVDLILDTNWQDDNELTPGNLVKDMKDEGYWRSVYDLSAEVEQALLDARLTAREQAILQWRFGIARSANGSFVGLRHPDKMTQAELAQQLGISQMHVSRIEKRLVAKVSRFLTAMPV